MKTVSLLLVLSYAAAAQAPSNVVACDAANTQQCKTTTIEGRPMRALVHEGTSIAVGTPVVTGEGDYRVFVRVSRVGPGKTDLKPKHFSGLSSDPAQTRLAFYDKAAEIQERIREADRAQQADDTSGTPRRPGSATSMGASKAAKLGLRKTDPNEVAGRKLEAANSKSSGTQPGVTVTPEELYLTQCTLRQGDFAEGFVYFKKPRRSKGNAGQSDPLHEIDIPVDGVVFQFNFR